MRRMIPQKQIDVLNKIQDGGNLRGVIVDDAVLISGTAAEDEPVVAGNETLYVAADQTLIPADEGNAAIYLSGGELPYAEAYVNGQLAVEIYTDEDGNYIDTHTDEVNIGGTLHVDGDLQASNFSDSTNTQAATITDGVVYTPISLLSGAHCAIIKIAQLVTSVENFEDIYVKMAIDGEGYYIAPIYGDDSIAFLIAQFQSNLLVLNVFTINATASAQTITSCTDVQVRWLKQY